jgi:hypothetical protein
MDIVAVIFEKVETAGPFKGIIIEFSEFLAKQKTGHT